MGSVLFGFIGILLISVASFVGLLTISIKSKNIPDFYNVLIAYATGVLLASVFYDLLPETVNIYNGFTATMSTLILIGIIIPFILEKTVHWHHHHSLDHKELDHHENQDEKVKPFVYINLLGDGLHNFVDGAILIATFSFSTELGIATLLSILIHELAQEMGDFAILIQGGLSVKKALFFNFLTALTAMLGGLIALLIDASLLEKIILPIAAGNFLYLAIADMIPELNKKVERKDWLLQLGIGAFGIATIYSLSFI